jgi:hypothetical protein
MSCTSCCFDAARHPQNVTPGNLEELASLLHGACTDCPQALSFLRNLPPALQTSLARAYFEGEAQGEPRQRAA